ncbi:MAG: TatD family hydrolase [Candidatus Omnitrophica bacterium]|nr:TatD family hydrolase [Candidatus Omnitrophota bacterium]
MGFVDTHVHLHFPDFDQDREEVIRRAQDAGVDFFINVGTDVKSSQASLALAESHSNIRGSGGIHPHDAKDATEQAFGELETILQHPKMIAVGEVGLDFYRDHSPKEKQKEVLRRFIAIHQKVKKPLILHCRNAYEDLMVLLKEEMAPPYRGVMHCFSSTTDTMRKFVDAGFYISFAGPLTYKKNDELREACKECPIDRLLLETDAPFLPPQSMRGKRNESSLMMETAQVAAGLHGLDLETLAARTTQNARKVFAL